MRYWRAQPRLFSAGLAGVVLWLLLPRSWRDATRLLIAWDAFTGLYLTMAAVMMAASDVVGIRRRAARQDEGQVAILGLTTLTALVSLGAIVAELTIAKTLKAGEAGLHIGLVGVTVLLSWTFTHAMFALHYAHEYYAGPENFPTRGLDFPRDESPDYWDFAYYAFVIGTACATADVNVSSKTMRRITAVHCVVAFLFNTTILALTVNIGAGFF